MPSTCCHTSYPSSAALLSPVVCLASQSLQPLVCRILSCCHEDHVPFIPPPPQPVPVSAHMPHRPCHDPHILMPPRTIPPWPHAPSPHAPSLHGPMHRPPMHHPSMAPCTVPPCTIPPWPHAPSPHAPSLHGPMHRPPMHRPPMHRPSMSPCPSPRPSPRAGSSVRWRHH
ncbi:unnamed protein product [Closterium sp. NIES-54]